MVFSGCEIHAEKRALVLMMDSDLFKKMKAFLEEREFSVKDEWEELRDFEVAVLDPFFLKAGMLDFLASENPGLPVVLLRGEEEVGESFLEEENLYDTLRIPRFEVDEAGQCLAAWAAKPESQILFNDFHSGFGRGLWVQVARSF